MASVTVRRVAQLRLNATKLLRLAAEIEADVPDSEGTAALRARPKDRIWAELNTEITLGRVLAEYRGRRRRNRFFSADLFGEPAWDLLLDLFAARLQNRKISVSSACIAADVPPTTALRWLGVLEQSDLIERIDDASDQRVTWVKLTDTASRAMFEFFDELGERSSSATRDIERFLIVEKSEV